MKVILVVGARPNFMKIAPILHEIKYFPEIESILVHTGQHYDQNMSNVFFSELNIPKPEFNLEVGSGSHAWQTAEIMKRFERVLLDENPDLVMVVGDVNSTIACSLTAVKMNIKVAHVEAGLRSNNWEMPEEINRVLTDRLSDLLLTSCSEARGNLLREGIADEKIHFVGNVMIDSLLKHSEMAESSSIHDDLGITPNLYAVLTLHRPGNVDSREKVERIINILEKVQKQITIIYPAHPRTRKQFDKYGLDGKIGSMHGLKIIDPLGYLDFLKLVKYAKFMLTDSGGIQEETTVLGVPCLTMREETERPVTVTVGTNMIVGLDEKLIYSEINKILNGRYPRGRIPELWDGRAAERIVRILLQELGD